MSRFDGRAILHNFHVYGALRAFLCLSSPASLLSWKLHAVNLSQVSEKRWYWLKVFALATIRDWDALEKFSKEKRPPIGKLFNSINFRENQDDFA